MGGYLENKDTEDVTLNNEMDNHWRMVYEDTKGRVDDQKALVHAQRWDIYLGEK